MSDLIKHQLSKVLTMGVREQKKKIKIGKEEVNSSLFADDVILYRENPKKSTKSYWN